MIVQLLYVIAMSGQRAGVPQAPAELQTSVSRITVPVPCGSPVTTGS